MNLVRSMAGKGAQAKVSGGRARVRIDEQRETGLSGACARLSCRAISQREAHMAHSSQFLKLVQDAKKNVKETNVADVKRRGDAGEKFLLVDVREDNEWAKGHLPGAVHLGKGIIERDIEQRVPDTERKADSVLRRRVSLRAGRGKSAEDGLHQRGIDGRRLEGLGRSGPSDGEGLNADEYEAQSVCIHCKVEHSRIQFARVAKMTR